MEEEPNPHAPNGYESWTIEQRIAITTYIAVAWRKLEDGTAEESIIISTPKDRDRKNAENS